jgi:hypothetical protein
MKNITRTLFAILLTGLFYNADAQYGYGFGYGPPPRHRQEQSKPEEKDSGPAKPTGYFELSIGLATPTGSFASPVGLSYNGKYALPGLAFNASAGIPIAHTNIGIALMYGYYNNPFDINSYVNNVQFSDQTKSYSPITQDSYVENFVMAGLFWTWPIERFSFDARFMGGIAVCNLPEIYYGADYAYGPYGSGYYEYTWDYAPSSSIAFAFDIGGDARYKLRRSSIMFGVDYIHASTNANTTLNYTDANGINWPYNVHSGVSIANLTFTLGVGYQIGK